MKYNPRQAYNFLPFVLTNFQRLPTSKPLPKCMREITCYFYKEPCMYKPIP